MKILVTGGAGFIGSNFIFHQLFHHNQDQIICVDKLTYAGNLSTLKSVLNKPNFTFYKADISNRQEMESIISKELPDIIVN